MKILFVDDDPQILKAFARVLFRRDDWETAMSDSAAKGLCLLEEEGDFDIVFSDMHMPLGLSGLEFLTLVQSRYPSIVRVVISGHASMSDTLGIIPLAHRALAKPCPVEQMEQVIDELAVLHTLVADARLRDLATSIKALPPIPALYQELTNAMEDPTRTLASLAEIVEADPAISAKLLQVVNSPFFGMKHAARSVSDAVVRLGSQSLRTIVLGMEAQRLAPHGRQSVVDVEALQDRSFRAAALARDICPDRSLKGDAFTAALLQDVGVLLLMMGDSAAHELAWSSAGGDFHQAEKSADLVQHGQLGAYLLCLWGIPAPIVEAVRCHHEPSLATRDKSLVGVVHIASAIMEGREPDREFIEAEGLGPLLQEARKAAGR